MAQSSFGRRRRRRRRQNRRVWIISLSLAICLLLVLSGVHVYQIYTDIRAGQLHLERARDGIFRAGLGATSQDLLATDVELRAARNRLQRARAGLSVDPALHVLGVLPKIQTQVQAIDRLLDGGIASIDFARAAVEIGRSRYDPQSMPSAGLVTERAQAWLQQTGPQSRQLEESLDRMLQAHRGIANAALVPPLAVGRDQLGELLPQAERLTGQWTVGREMLPSLLGMNGSRSYLVLALNEGELLPGGGLVSAVGRLTLDGGRVREITMQDSIRFGEEWQARDRRYVTPPTPLKQYLLRDVTWSLTVSTWSPDFPTNAQRAVEFWKLAGGAPVDGVIAVDLESLRAMLALTGPVTLDGYQIALTEENAVLELERVTRQPYEPISLDRKAIVGDLARTLIPRLLSLQGERWGDLAQTLAALTTGRHIMMWSVNPAEQQALTLLGIDGGVRDVPTDYLMLVDGSVQSTKLNLVIRPESLINVSLNADGGADHEIEVTYFNDLPTWAQGRDKALVDQLMLGGVYGNYARLYSLAGSELQSLKLNGVEAGAESIDDELGKRSFGRFFTVGPGERKSITYRYYTTGVLAFSARGAEYSLFLQKQPGAAASRAVVRIDPPPGYTVKTVSVNARTESSHQVSVNLDEDVLITASLVRS